MACLASSLPSAQLPQPSLRKWQPNIAQADAPPAQTTGSLLTAIWTSFSVHANSRQILLCHTTYGPTDSGQMETEQLNMPPKHTNIWLQLRFQAFGDLSFRRGNHPGFSLISLWVFTHWSSLAHKYKLAKMWATLSFPSEKLLLTKARTPTHSLLPSPVTDKAAEAAP